ncbi:MAG: FAD-dependent oxidoreductase [Actinobacteria bacterium]|nr:FAD-dependent oxidoreductase [Actinomycetota bacterium]
MSGRKIGVYVCHCGGNISDYVDVEKVVEELRSDPDVVVARTAMFTCSDATQQEIIEDIKEQNLDGIVVASCSPKLHTFTFRGVAKRGGLSPYQYTQVNVREQCSWTHTDDHAGATAKATRLVKAGVGRTRLTVPLEPIVVETVPKAVVIGGGVAGLRAALGLAEIGIAVFLVEREPRLGGWVAGFGEMYPHGKNGSELVGGLVQQVRQNPGITVFTNAEVTGKSGSFGNYRVDIRVDRETGETVSVEAGSIVVSTGFDVYSVAQEEFGYGLEGVVTLPEFKCLVDSNDGVLEYNGRPIKNIVYIYCVGSRQDPDVVESARRYCSRYCCTAAVHASLQVAAKPGRVHQYHLHRDVRTYGKYEKLYDESLNKGSVYLKVPDHEPPSVKRDPETGRLLVTTRDLLAEGDEVEILADMVVLVTGMVPRANEELTRALKLPVGKSGFFNEIHPKLRPVETVVDGVYICGTCQQPMNSAEAVSSGLAAVTQSASILKKGFAELDPLVAVVDTGACTWCGLCDEACPYGAPQQVHPNGKSVALIDKTACKGCGGCVPVCPTKAIDLEGYTDAQIRAMIDGMLSTPSAANVPEVAEVAGVTS